MDFIKEFWEFLKIRKKYWLLPIIMGVIFFLVVTPIGFLMKLLGKDLINLKFNSEKSYWIEKSGPKSKMKNQF